MIWAFRCYNYVTFILIKVTWPMSLLFVQIGVILLGAKLLGILFHKMRQPQVMGEIIGGIVLGPSILGQYFPTVFHALFPADGLGAISALSQVGIVLFMFLV